jgi:hypothetical protein
MRSKSVTLGVVIVICTVIFSSKAPLHSTNNSLKESENNESPHQLHSISEIKGFSENRLLSTKDDYYDHHVEPTLAIGEDGTIYAGWKNSDTHNGGGVRVSFSKSTNGGIGWTQPRNMPMFDVQLQANKFGLADDEFITTRQSDPWLFWRNDNIYYAYLEFAPDVPDFSQITVASSDDNGDTWNPVSASFSGGFADKETMWVDYDGTIYVAYDDIDGRNNVTIRVTRSTDGGSSFNEVSIVGTPDPGHLAPYVTTNTSGHVFIASTFFNDFGGTLLLSKSEDMGETFGEPQFINNDGFHGDFTQVDGLPAKGTIPVLRFDQYDRLYVLWADRYDQSHTFDIYLRYSDDFGETWSDRIQINPISEGDQWQPDMDIDSEGNLHLVFYDEQNSVYRPYYRKLQFSGESRSNVTLSDTIVIADADTSSEFTRPGDYFTIRLDSNDVPHVVWTDGRNDEMDIYYAHGTTTAITTTTATTTTTSSDTTTSTTTSIFTNTSNTFNLDSFQILIAISSGLAVVFIVVVIVYYRSKR